MDSLIRRKFIRYYIQCPSVVLVGPILLIINTSPLEDISYHHGIMFHLKVNANETQLSLSFDVAEKKEEFAKRKKCECEICVWIIWVSNVWKTKVLSIGVQSTHSHRSQI